MSNRAVVEESGAQTQRPVKESPGKNRRPSTLDKVRSEVSEILTRDEAIIYIAIQKRPLVPVAPACIVLTNRRFIIYRPKLLGGVNFDDHVWREVKTVKLSEGVMGSTFKIITDDEETLSVDYLPRTQARRLYSLTREIEERIRSQADRLDSTIPNGCNLECCQTATQIARSNGKNGKDMKASRNRPAPRPETKTRYRSKQVAVG